MPSRNPAGSNAPEERIRALLIEDDGRLVRSLAFELRDADSAFPGPQIELEWAERVAVGFERVAARVPDVLLVDLSVPDARGLETVMRARSEAPDLPLVVLLAHPDPELALQTLRAGAEDCLVKGELDGRMLSRAIRYAIERNRARAAQHILSLVDELTGLYNRRGFFSLADQRVKLARRNSEGLLVFFVDLDHMKRVNDTFGHREGDRALCAAADILRRTFRNSDLVARIGGDEFTTLASDPPRSGPGPILRRLEANLKTHNGRGQHPHALSFSVGCATFDPAKPTSIDELLAEADRALYEDKRSGRVK